MINIYIVIPAYNEERVIGEVISQVVASGYKNIIVVDDGSEDNTAKIAKSRGSIVVSHIINRGAGASTQTGINAALELGADIIVLLDGDGQHNVSDIKKLVDPIIAHKADVVIGARIIFRQDMPKIRRISNFIGNLITAVFFGMWVKDSQSGFKAFSRDAAKKIEIKTNGYEFCSEIIREIKIKKLALKEIPTRVKYSRYSLDKGQGFYQGIKTAYKIILQSFIR